MGSTQPNILHKLSMLYGKRRALIIAALVITSLVVTGFVWAQKKVLVIADGRSQSITTVHSDPAEVLAQANVFLGPQDEYRVSTAKLASGTTIEVFRAIPVTVIYQGKSEIKITGKPTVGEVAESLGFTAVNSRTVLDPSTRVTPGMTIRIVDVTEKNITREVTMSPQVVRQPDTNLEKGTEEVVQQGNDGLKQVTFKLRYEDGQEVAAEATAEKVLVEPTPQIVKVGTRDTVQTSRGAMRFRQVYNMVATAYNPTDGAPHGLTAMGIPARHGIVAVDPNVIPLGSRVYVPGYGLALAADVGGDIKGYRIDLCMEGYDEAWSFGRRNVKVYVIAD